MTNIVYTSTTGDSDAELIASLRRAEALGLVEFITSAHEPHCYVCRRHTDHFAEHDSLVGLGLAEYSDNGDVLVTDFARTHNGDMVRRWYDRAITLGIHYARYGVVLIKPEGYAVTRAFQNGVALPGRDRL